MDVSDGSETDNEKRSYARHIRLKHRLQPKDHPDPDFDGTDIPVHKWQIVDQMLFARLEGKAPHFRTDHDYDFESWGNEDYLALVEFKRRDAEIARRNFRQRQHGMKYADQDKRWAIKEGREGKWLNPPFVVPEWNLKSPHRRYIPDVVVFPVLERGKLAVKADSKGQVKWTSSIDEEVNEEDEENNNQDDYGKAEDVKDEGKQDTYHPHDILAPATTIATQSSVPLIHDPNDADGENSTDEESAFTRYWRTKQVGKREHNIDRRIRKKFGQGLTRIEWALHRERVDTGDFHFLRIEQGMS
jgi:hypothetical protein